MCTVCEATQRDRHCGSRLQAPAFLCVALLFGFPRAERKAACFV